MEPTSSVAVQCVCRKLHRFDQPNEILTKMLVVKTCEECRRPVTKIWSPPTRFNMLEID